jgi:hypothetical protein
MKRLGLIVGCWLLTACNSFAPPPCDPPQDGDIVYVTQGGWHTELGIPENELEDGLSFYRTEFPDAQVVIFGYGKETFFTADHPGFDDYILGPFPGHAVIQAIGLRRPPPEVYPEETTIVLRLPPGGRQALTQFIWNDLVKDRNGRPIITAYGHSPASLFYAANSEYNIGHTCNTWIVEALQATGLSLSAADVIFSGQAMEQAVDAATQQCREN